MADYVSTDAYVQHSPQVADGIDEDVAVFDLFRLENGQIVEHWDCMEPLPRGENLVNQGKF